MGLTIETAAPTVLAEVKSPQSTVWATTAGAAALILLAGVCLVWSILDPEWYAEWLMAVILAGFLIAGVYGSLSVRVARTVLTADELICKYVFKTRRFPRAEIVGWRLEEGPNLFLERKGKRALNVTAEILSDPVFVAWLNTLSDLNAQQRAEAERDLDGNPDFGWTVAERRERVAVFAKRARWLNLLGLGVGIWALVYPRPYDIAVAAAAVMPVLALLLTATSRGLYSVGEGGAAEPRPDLNGLFFVPIGAIMVRGLQDSTLIDWHEPLILGGMGGLVFAALMAAVDRRLAKSRTALGFYALFAVGYVGGGAAIANNRLDHAEPTVFETRVIDRSAADDDDLTVTVAPWAGVDGPQDIRVWRELHAKSASGTRFCVAQYGGVFGWRYVYAAETCRDAAGRSAS